MGLDLHTCLTTGRLQDSMALASQQKRPHLRIVQTAHDKVRLSQPLRQPRGDRSTGAHANTYTHASLTPQPTPPSVFRIERG